MLSTLADFGFRIAERRRESGSKYRGADIAASSEEQLGRPGFAGLPSAHSLMFWLGYDRVHRAFCMAIHRLFSANAYDH